MNLLGDPAVINQMAAVLDQKAGQLRSVGRRVQERADRSRGRWECSKADRFRHDMAGRRQQAEGMANDLQGLASDLRRLATQVQNQIDWFHGLESKVHNAIEAAGHDAQWALQHGIDLTRLPATGDPAWEGIAKRLGL